MKPARVQPNDGLSIKDAAVMDFARVSIHKPPSDAHDLGIHLPNPDTTTIHFDLVNTDMSSVDQAEAVIPDPDSDSREEG
jgi:hypothetical protein